MRAREGNVEDEAERRGGREVERAVKREKVKKEREEREGDDEEEAFVFMVVGFWVVGRWWWRWGERERVVHPRRELGFVKWDGR